MDLKALLSYCESNCDVMVRMLQEAVEIESPSNSARAIMKISDFWAGEFRRSGAAVQLHDHSTAGCALTAEFWKEIKGRRPVLLLGHTDTVWGAGTIASMPFRLRGGRAFGPGVLDMKSGLVIGAWAIRALRSCKILPGGPVRFFLNPDEETGSLAFRKLILREARRARACLVLEPAANGGAVKTARKGVGIFKVTVRGRSAHAGINPEEGVSAISELAAQIQRIEGFARPKRGLSVNVGTIEGGTRTNVIPENASATVDVRVASSSDAGWIESRMGALKPIHDGARIFVEGGINRPPMERRHARGLFAKARDLAAGLGFDLQEASTGGGSDGSFAAAMGVPTLDGLGGVGVGAHARHEQVIIR
ncbi:MAG: M20 family metallopeptidase, partial [Acidobacteriota bacterium]|nr:M20 family metallopeptidase [Acidobacteriota bacterium]